MSPISVHIESGETLRASGLLVKCEFGGTGRILLDLLDVRLDFVPSGEDILQGDNCSRLLWGKACFEAHSST